MNSKQNHWWQPVIILLESYPVLASFVIIGWERNSEYALPGFVYVWLGGLVSFLGLLVSGVILIFRHRTRWGLIALAFALYAFFFFFVAIPSTRHN